MEYHWSFKIALFAFVVIAFAIPASAHKGATGIVKERMDAMGDMKDAVAVIGNMLRGKTEYQTEGALAAAGQLIRHGSRIRDQFPDTPESRQNVSEATELVWTDRARFDSFAEDFVETVLALEAAVAIDDRDAVSASFRLVGKSCSACHEDFRQKKH